LGTCGSTCQPTCDHFKEKSTNSTISHSLALSLSHSHGLSSSSPPLALEPLQGNKGKEKKEISKEEQWRSPRRSTRPCYWGLKREVPSLLPSKELKEKFPRIKKSKGRSLGQVL
jgi:hypothetical protein